MIKHPSRRHALALAAAATAAAVGLSPAARADTYSFLDDVRSLGFVGEPGDLVSTGYIACEGLDLNRPVAEVYQWIHSSRTSDAVTEGQTARFLAAAVLNLCPRNLDRVAAAGA